MNVRSFEVEKITVSIEGDSNGYEGAGNVKWASSIPYIVFKPTADIDLSFSFVFDMNLIVKKSRWIKSILFHQVGNQVGCAGRKNSISFPFIHFFFDRQLVPADQRGKLFFEK